MKKKRSQKVHRRKSALVLVRYIGAKRARSTVAAATDERSSGGGVISVGAPVARRRVCVSLLYEARLASALWPLVALVSEFRCIFLHFDFVR